MAAKTQKSALQRKGLFSRLPGGNVLVVTILLLAGGVLAAVIFCEMQRKMTTMRQEQVRVQYGVLFAQGDVPVWMPPELMEIIRREITPAKMSFNDEKLCPQVLALAQKNPWIRKIREIRKIRKNDRIGQVIVSVEFRRPFVRVSHNHMNYFVDEDGVRLPTQQVPQWKAIVDGQVYYYLDAEDVPVAVRPLLERFMIICGAEAPAPEVGKQWPGEDIQAGLKLAKLVNTRTYARQISVIDIRNYRERITDSEPSLRMFAQIDNGRPTDIRFGRFMHPEGGDWYVTPEQRMEYLDSYVIDHGGRLAGINDFIELRKGQLYVSPN